jgi:putative Ca2+/H+ antiporter (TMEM165/GDT1 family)
LLSLEPLLVSTGIVAAAEMGDKTQLATVALAARYHALAMVVAGTTIGMMIANVPAVYLGEALAHRVNLTWMRWTAAALFVALGVLTFFAGDDALRVAR